MATNFPTGLDALTNPTSTDTLNSPSHAGQHTDANDAIEALQAKVGVNGSAVTTSHDYKIAELEKKQYVTLASDSQLANERVLTAGTGITVTDAGAGSTVTVATSAVLPTVVDAKGDLLVGSAADTVARFGVGANGDLLVADSGSTSGLRWQGQEVAGRNKIINGNMMVAQRGTSFTSTGGANNDDTYTLDRWYILSDGNDAIDVTQSTDAPTGGLNSIALDVETINKKFGIAQIIEQKNCIGLIGETVTLSFRARVSSTTKLDNVKAAIVAWSGTADTVTSDIISAWGAEGTNPTLIANATYENTPANLNVTTSWASYSVTANVDTASTKNIIVFIWSDVTDTTLGDFLYVTGVQLEYGSVATRFTMHGGGFEGELAACQRYYTRLTAPAFHLYSLAVAYSTTNIWANVKFPVSMRVRPTAVEVSATASNYKLLKADATTVNATTSPTFDNSSVDSAMLICVSTSGGVVAGNASGLMSSGTDSYLGFSAEL